VSNLDLDVRGGECWAVVGPNGAGKTTLIATLAGLRPATAGSIAYDSDALETLSPRERARRRGYLPQDSVDHFPASVQETVLVGRHPHLGRFEWESAADLARASAALARFGLGGFETRDVRTLSGGERRRVALAALVAQEPGLMLLDEPSSHLDLGQQVAALDALAALARERGTALVMVLHDLHLALRYADHAIALGGGRAVTGRADEVLTADALSALFGHRLAAVGTGSTRTLLPS
jgi:iron complex transport system ATP-binding protein